MPSTDLRHLLGLGQHDVEHARPLKSHAVPSFCVFDLDSDGRKHKKTHGKGKKRLKKLAKCLCARSIRASQQLGVLERAPGAHVPLEGLGGQLQLPAPGRLRASCEAHRRPRGLQELKKHRGRPENVQRMADF